MSRTAISAAVDGLGWRYVLGLVRTAVPVGSFAAAAEAASLVSAVAGADADGHLWLDVRADRLIVSVQTRALGRITDTDLGLVRRVTDTLAGHGLRPEPGGESAARPVQMLEIAIDALDIPAIRPFWKAILGYVDEAGSSNSGSVAEGGDGDPTDALVDPYDQGPAFWFQQMDAPRPQRNRIHFDMSMAPEEAPGRIEAALAAGGTMVSDLAAPRFWVLADAEGNEICVCTWAGRDEYDASRQGD
jgi:4a-hydroxytetrahydrobiopterin dehydratase